MRRRAAALLFLAAALSSAPAMARTADAPLFAVARQGEGHVVVRLPAAGADGVIGRYLYTPSIAGGLGAAEIGADRAGLGQTQIIVFRREIGRAHV